MKVINIIMYLLYAPLYIFYLCLYFLCLAVETILKPFGIDKKMRNQVKEVLHGQGIGRQCVYALFRLINVGIFAYALYKIRSQSFDDINSIVYVIKQLFICSMIVIVLHFFKKVLFNRLGITPYYAVSDKNMDGVSFEDYCAHLLSVSGYKKLEMTKASGDQGVDIIATYKREKYAIQCKYYSTPIGNRAIQEVYAGKVYYECDKAMVMTNQGFTRSARALGESVDVQLWGNITIKGYGIGIVVFWYVVDIILVCIAMLSGYMI